MGIEDVANPNLVYRPDGQAMSRPLRAATCFSGIGAPEVAGPQYDWIWHAEIEPFPAAVLAARHGASRPIFLPDPEADDIDADERRARMARIKSADRINSGNRSINFGDVLHPDFIARAKELGPLDLMAGGPPCQAFSFAGLRQSMGDARGNLSLRWVQILHAIRPRNAITENVPGWLSTEDNAFGCFLGALVGSDGPLFPCERPRSGKSNDGWRWIAAKDGKQAFHAPQWTSVGMVAGPLGRAAWRLLDAQHFGLPQRRERVFVVSDFGDGADPASVLFERQGLSGNHPPRRDTGQGFTYDVAPSLTASGRGVERSGESRGQDPIVAEIVGTLNSVGGNSVPGNSVQDAMAGQLICEISHTLRREGYDASEDGRNRTTLIPERRAFGGGNTAGPIDLATTQTTHERFDFETETFVAEPVAFSHQAGGTQTTLGFDPQSGTRPALSVGQTPAIAYMPARTLAADGGVDSRYAEREISDAVHTGTGADNKAPIVVEPEWRVRRLTPLECERLQGFPDGYTLIEFGSRRSVDADEAEYLVRHGAVVDLGNDGIWRTNYAADGPRYKALGNSWATECGKWIIARIADRQR